MPRLFHDGVTTPKHLAYVEWFCPFPKDPDPYYNMFKITRSIKEGKRVSSIIPVAHIMRSIHLYPKWDGPAPRDWSKDNVLDECKFFYASPYSDKGAFVKVL